MTLFGIHAVAIETYMTSVGAVGVVAIALAYLYYREAAEDEFADAGPEVALEPPNIKRSWFGPIAAYWHLRQKRKLAGKGYVQWFLVDDGWPRPKFVKPSDHGGGQFEYEHDGETYLFPREALLPSRDEGMWTVIHDKGEAKPRNLRTPDEFSISAKQLHDYVTARVTIEPPGWLQNLNLEPRNLIKYAIFAFIALVLIQGALQGGLP